MGKNWLEHKLLVNPKEFKKCCEFYFGDMTFEEAYQKTGKHVCISVSASHRGCDKGASDIQELLLNHISTPHVTIASAVSASCALPGLMAPVKLITKNQDAKLEIFEDDGKEWIDGSIQADLPFEKLSSLFNVTNFIVCQTNFFILPFLHNSYNLKEDSTVWKVFKSCTWDMNTRVLNLIRLGLFPKLFGEDVSTIFNQKYHGDLTLIPKFNTKQKFGLKVLDDPSYEDMEGYLRNGQISTWPYLGVIREMLRLETAIDKGLKNLSNIIGTLNISNDHTCIKNIDETASVITLDTVDSMLSYSRSLTSDCERTSTEQEELLEERVIEMEFEVSQLKNKLKAIKKLQKKM